MLQLVHLYFTNIKKDEKSFASVMSSMETELRNREVSPEAAFNDSVSATISAHNPYDMELKLADLKNISYDRILQIAKEQTANAAAFTFTIVGNYDEATIRPLIEQYIASLPSQKKVVKGKNIVTNFKGEAINHFKRKMETPQANSIVVWYTDKLPYTLENSIRANIAGQILSMIYLKSIREDAGAAYSCGAVAQTSKNDFEEITRILAYCPLKPEMAEQVFDIMRKEINGMSKTVDADKLQKVKEYMHKKISDVRKTNNYWMQVINMYTNYGIDVDTNYDAVVDAQTPETIAATVGEILKSGNRAEILMLPQD